MAGVTTTIWGATTGSGTLCIGLFASDSTNMPQLPTVGHWWLVISLLMFIFRLSITTDLSEPHTHIRSP